ncbi:RING/FYVE/PHD zinc finger superfamily protein [Perilla frutescens var. hirtella]|uniref:RING/FYVE/PHD zinc finger superfamily protein n=1 Tax=Perilla frutescens var. hirtella TaxID=608512 RepID=A0AAD4IW24_PERFH|nr:RING/FYVE/PHD zinc finger superfamily protein [Perilla frutescens var. hirtella]KAH6804799.1 RING/FYVE/PHD zinc finger superfamily protein [Perilla frutescens var. frutescens]KAH6822457.1 RING/FYVE/PHD zinc finger superfamily protein [Perilla frutescens var. hirtella]
MGDHFVLLVDRLLTESTLEAAIESGLKQVAPITVDEAIIDYSFHKDSDASLSPRKVAECRICQDEDFDSNMEAPCSCSGSLKYAHRRCVQKWCNEKGDTMCEICHQQFKPGYTAPPPIFRFGGLPMNLRGNWQIARRDLNNPRIIAMVSSDHSFLDPEYDEYAVSTSRSIVCCRTVAIIFMVLLILRHTLPVIVSRAGNYSLPLIILLILRVAGIILPICIILKAVTSIIRRRQQQQANSMTPASDEESSPLTLNQPSVNAVS